MATDQIFFSSRLADVLFGDKPSGGGPLVADAVVERFEGWLAAIPTTTALERHRLHILAAYLDKQLVAKLPGAYQLRIARIIEAKIPEILVRMPTLSRREKHLRRASELAEIFMPDSLERLAMAIQEEVE